MPKWTTSRVANHRAIEHLDPSNDLAEQVSGEHAPVSLDVWQLRHRSGELR